MNDFPGIDPIGAIDLRWTLRDIKAKRTMFPVDPDHLRTLIELGLVERGMTFQSLQTSDIKFLIKMAGVNGRSALNR